MDPGIVRSWPSGGVYDDALAAIHALARAIVPDACRNPSESRIPLRAAKRIYTLNRRRARRANESLQSPFMHGARCDDRPLVRGKTRRHTLEGAERDDRLQATSPFGACWTASQVRLDDATLIASDVVIEHVAQLRVRHVPMCDGTCVSRQSPAG